MIPRAALAALLEKYTTLVEMRERELRGEPPNDNAFYRRLARRFPGALKELDQLPLDELRGRVVALRELDESAPPAAWMIAVVHYHGYLRASLYLRQRERSDEATSARATSEETARPTSDETVRATCDVTARASELAGFPLTTIEIDRLRPRAEPRGDARCSVVPMIAELTATRSGVSLDVVRAALALRPPRARP